MAIAFRPFSNHLLKSSPICNKTQFKAQWTYSRMSFVTIASVRSIYPVQSVYCLWCIDSSPGLTPTQLAVLSTHLTLLPGRASRVTDQIRCLEISSGLSTPPLSMILTVKLLSSMLGSLAEMVTGITRPVAQQYTLKSLDRHITHTGLVRLRFRIFRRKTFTVTGYASSAATGTTRCITTTLARRMSGTLPPSTSGGTSFSA